MAASTLWVPAMVVAARAMRPPQLDDYLAQHFDPAPFALAASHRMWEVLGASFLVLLGIVLTAIIPNRRAAHRPGAWAAGGLVVGLGLALAITSVVIQGWASQIAPPVFVGIDALIMAAAAAGVILGASPADVTSSGGTVERYAPRAALVVGALVFLVDAAFTAFVALFIASFYLHIVY
jgi:hypothetical protein